MSEPTFEEIDVVAKLLHWLKGDGSMRNDWWVIDEAQRNPYRIAAKQLIKTIRGSD